MSQIGFVLLTHAKPEQMLRLVNRLNTMFGDPPIVCHHDFGKCPLPNGFLPANVEFVRPHIDTKWGEFSLVEAVILALTRMYARPDAPDWCVVLSGADYPTKPAAQILENLSAGGYDAHLDGKEVKPDRLDDDWHRMFADKFCLKTVDVISVDKRLRPRPRRLRLPYRIGKHFLPFREDLRCYAGSQWFTVGRRAAKYIIEFQKTPDAGLLARYYRRLTYSDESYFQTVLCNAAGLHLNNVNWLYADFSDKKPNPKVLTLDHYKALENPTVHIARKFDPERSAALLDALDAVIDGNVVDMKETVSR